jgi:hypothetical protein
MNLVETNRNNITRSRIFLNTVCPFFLISSSGSFLKINAFQKNTTDTVSTYYNYDIHGNVKSLQQQLPGFEPKQTQYLYDLISGKVRLCEDRSSFLKKNNKMATATIILTNGFPNVPGKGELLTGTLLDGNIDPNDLIILDDEVQITIIEVEIDKATFPGTTRIVLTVPRNLGIAWPHFYNKALKIKKAL